MFAEVNATEDLEKVTEVMQAVAEEPEILKEYLEKIMSALTNFGIKLIFALLIYFIGSKLIKLSRKMLGRFLERANVDEGARQFMDSFTKFVLYFFLIVLVSTRFGVDSASVVAILGSAGLAIGLALQGSLSNFAGGVLILIIKPFKVGDYIIEGNQKNEGTVTEIQMFYTILTTLDNKSVVVPNGTLVNSILTNVTHLEKRRLAISVNIPYQEDIKKVKELLTEILEGEESRVPENAVNVFVESLEESYIKMGCHIWVNTGDFFAVKCRLIEEIKSCLYENNMNVPYNQLDVFIKNTSEH